MEEKLKRAVSNAANYAEKALNALSQGGLEELRMLVWRLAAELEYALFLLSLKRSELLESPPLKPHRSGGNVEISPVLAVVRERVEEACRALRRGDYHGAYVKVREARLNLLSVQKLLEGAPRGGRRPTSSP